MFYCDFVHVFGMFFFNCPYPISNPALIKVESEISLLLGGRREDDQQKIHDDDQTSQQKEKKKNWR
jgi:hypothetical protein